MVLKIKNILTDVPFVTFVFITDALSFNEIFRFVRYEKANFIEKTTCITQVVFSGRGDRSKKLIFAIFYSFNNVCKTPVLSTLLLSVPFPINIKNKHEFSKTV